MQYGTFTSGTPNQSEEQLQQIHTAAGQIDHGRFMPRKLPSGVATVYTFRGESDEAFKWLDRAYAQKDTLLHGIKYRTEFDKLHDDPRYKAFLKKMNLPE